MRDQFISVAASQDEPPVLRAATPVATAQGIDAIDGIGPVFASRLKDSGIDDVSKLAAATPDTIAEAAGVSGARAGPGSNRPARWAERPYLHQPEDLGDLLEGEPSYRVDQLRKWLYRTPVLSNTDMTNLPAGVEGKLEPLWPFEVEAEQSADGGTTRKWLFRAPDGAAIEAVLMGYPGGRPCASRARPVVPSAAPSVPQGSLVSSDTWTPGEIMAQVAYAQAFLRQIGMPGTPGHLTNVVFMGMGRATRKLRPGAEALRRMIEVMGLSARSITVSTVGMVPGIRRLAEEPWAGLARGQPPRSRRRAPQHSSSDRQRYPWLRSRRLPRDIREEASPALHRVDDDGGRQRHGRPGSEARRNCPRLHAHVNLIALNPTPLTKEKASSETVIHSFARQLRRLRINVTVRDTRGRTIDGACGQLRLLAGKPGLKPRV